MERDLDKLIHKKVMDAERQPVAWRKEQVWVNISTGLRPKKADRRIYYYAAASVALLIAAGFFYVTRIDHDQHTGSMARSDAPATKAIPDSIQPAAVPVVAPHHEPIITLQKHKITTTPELTVPETSVTNEENITLLPVADTVMSASVAEVIQPQQKERIKPVIGVFRPTEPEPEVAVQKKRRKLPLFKPGHDDSSPLENPSENIIARIH